MVGECEPCLLFSRHTFVTPSPQAFFKFFWNSNKSLCTTVTGIDGKFILTTRPVTFCQMTKFLDQSKLRDFAYNEIDVTEKLNLFGKSRKHHW